jgi:hypothetical protein
MYLEIDVFGIQSFSFGRLPKAKALDSNNRVPKAKALDSNNGGPKAEALDSNNFIL